MTTVNLRAVGTDMANPRSGTLVGTAEVGGAPLLIEVLAFSPEGHRFFLLSFQYSCAEPMPEYIEVVPVRVVSTAPLL